MTFNLRIRKDIFSKLVVYRSLKIKLPSSVAWLPLVILGTSQMGVAWLSIKIFGATCSPCVIELMVVMVLTVGLVYKSLSANVMPYIVEVDMTTGAVRNVGTV